MGLLITQCMDTFICLAVTGVQCSHTQLYQTWSQKYTVHGLWNWVLLDDYDDDDDDDAFCHVPLKFLDMHVLQKSHENGNMKLSLCLSAKLCEYGMRMC